MLKICSTLQTTKDDFWDVVLGNCLEKGGHFQKSLAGDWMNHLSIAIVFSKQTVASRCRHTYKPCPSGCRQAADWSKPLVVPTQMDSLKHDHHTDLKREDRTCETGIVSQG